MSQTDKNYKPPYLNSPVTIKKKEAIAAVAAITGYDHKVIDDIMHALAAAIENYNRSGVNFEIPYIGTFVIQKKYIPVNAYTAYRAKKLGTFIHPKNGREYLVIFDPNLVINDHFRAKITDNLPSAQNAYIVPRMPFYDGARKYNYDASHKTNDENQTCINTDME